MKKLYKTTDKAQLIEIVEEKFNSEEILIKPLMVGICRTDVNVALNRKGFEDKQNLTIGHEMVGLTNENLENQIVIINPSYQNNDFVGLDKNGCITEGYFSIPKEQVIFTNFLLEDNEVIYFDYDKDDFCKLNVETKTFLKSLAYLEPIVAAFAVVKPIKEKQPKKLLLIGENRIADLVKIIIKQQFPTLEMDNLSLKSTKNKDLSVYDMVIETELDQECFDLLIKQLKNNSNIILKSRSNTNINFKINDLVIKEISLISAKYDDFYKCLDWLLDYENLYLHLLGKDYPLEQWEEAFIESSKDHNKQKLFINLME